MRSFYQNMLIKKLPPDTALQETQKQMLRKYPNPHFWATFVFQGDFK